LEFLSSLTDDTGNVIERLLYNPYGEVTVLMPDGTSVLNTSLYDNPYMFTGRRLDAESSLMYYRSRMYSSKYGRFISRDPSDNLYQHYYVNTYEYVYGDPVSFIDPLGLDRVAAFVVGGLTRPGSAEDTINRLRDSQLGSSHGVQVHTGTEWGGDAGAEATLRAMNADDVFIFWGHGVEERSGGSAVGLTFGERQALIYDLLSAATSDTKFNKKAAPGLMILAGCKACNIARRIYAASAAPKPCIVCFDNLTGVSEAGALALRILDALTVQDPNTKKYPSVASAVDTAKGSIPTRVATGGSAVNDIKLVGDCARTLDDILNAVKNPPSPPLK
jgi:RHS repeat-associated protein